MLRLSGATNPGPRRVAAPGSVLLIVSCINNYLAKNSSLADPYTFLPPDVREYVPVFEASMGMSLQKYINRRQVERAMQILHKAPNTDLEEVAQEVGLRDFRELHGLFLKILLISPRAYRSHLRLCGRSRRMRVPLDPDLGDS